MGAVGLCNLISWILVQIGKAGNRPIKEMGVINIGLCGFASSGCGGAVSHSLQVAG